MTASPRARRPGAAAEAARGRVATHPCPRPTGDAAASAAIAGAAADGPGAMDAAAVQALDAAEGA